VAETKKQLSPPELVGRAREQVEELFGKPIEAVTGFEQADGKGWTVTLELLELPRIPDTTSLLGTYEATLDGDGNLLGARRLRRYPRTAGGGRMSTLATRAQPPGGMSLADLLERVLDKGIVIAGDVEVRLLDIELLTLKLRLLIASADTARSMGIDWWEHDPALSSLARDNELEQENRELRERLDRLERAIERNGR